MHFGSILRRIPRASNAPWSQVVNSPGNQPNSTTQPGRPSRFVRVRRFFGGKFRTATRQSHLDILVIIVLVTLTLGTRSWLAVQRKVMEPGDTFNFLFIAQALGQGRIPQHENRLPFYPLTILPLWKLGVDPLVAATAVSVVASGGTTVMLYLLGRRFRLHPLSLALVLLLFILTPLQNIVGIRPLADSLFLFLVLLSVYAASVVRPTRWSALGSGIIFSFMMATRFEGFLFAILLVPLLFFRLSWRHVFLATLPVLAMLIAWVPFTLYVHGTLAGGYFGQLSQGGDFGNLSQVRSKLYRIAHGTGWLRPWEQAAWVLDRAPSETSVFHLFRSASWWIGLLALIGIPWLLFIGRRNALPFLAVFLVYSSVYSLWFLYSRFVAPLTSAFYLAAAAGASALYTIVRQLVGQAPPRIRGAGAILVAIFLLWIVREEAPGLFTETVHTVFENQGSGYSLVLAIRDLRQREGRVALISDLMSTIYLGRVDEPLDPPHRALFLDAWIEDPVEGVVVRLRTHDIRFLIERNEPGVVRILETLKRHGVVAHTEEIRFPRGHPPGPDFDVTRIHTLAWEKQR